MRKNLSLSSKFPFKKSNINAFCLFGLLLLLASIAEARPLVIAHRGGGGEFPENTLYGFLACQKLGVDLIELDLQVTKDRVVVAYHPRDLSSKTQSSGSIASKTYDEIRQLTVDTGNHKEEADLLMEESLLRIPTFADVLTHVVGTPLILDLKSLPPAALIESIASLLNEHNGWSRVVFYSTSDEHMAYLNNHYPKAAFFEPRSLTRERLLHLRLNDKCKGAVHGQWVGYELERLVKVSEDLALGSGESSIKATLWTQSSVDCFRKMASESLYVVGFGIDDEEAFRQALTLKLTGIYTNNPRSIMTTAQKRESSGCEEPSSP